MIIGISIVVTAIVLFVLAFTTQAPVVESVNKIAWPQVGYTLSVAQVTWIIVISVVVGMLLVGAIIWLVIAHKNGWIGSKEYLSTREHKKDELFDEALKED